MQRGPHLRAIELLGRQYRPPFEVVDVDVQIALSSGSEMS
jgi:hypothetical protein